MITAIVGSPTRTNVLLAGAWRELGVDARVLWPDESIAALGDGDVALFRIDVLPTLDGIEPGLEAAPELERRGVRVLNRPAALLACHDKLRTAQLLAAAGVPHPPTVWLQPGKPVPDLALPCVVKPRFGSWGQDVFACRSERELAETIRALEGRPWFEHTGVLLQELIDTAHRDLRVVVAGRRVVAAAERIAAPGEWRTNVSLGGRIRPATVPDEASERAIRAAAATGTDLAGVDLLPTMRGWTVLELNAAVDFDRRYALLELDPYAAIIDALGIRRSKPRQPELTKEAVMAKTIKGKPPRAGDEIVITGHSVGDAPRTAFILEALGEPGHERYRVRWEDGHESIYFPADDAVVRRPARRRAPAA